MEEGKVTGRDREEVVGERSGERKGRGDGER